MTPRRAVAAAVAVTSAVALVVAGATPAGAVVAPIANGTFSRWSYVTPRPCPTSLTPKGCGFSITAVTGVFADDVGHCSEVGTIPGYYTLGCYVTFSVSATIDATCSAVGGVTGSVTFGSGVTGTSFSPTMTALSWVNGVIGFTANQVDASPTARAIYVSGSVFGACAVPAPAPETGQGWGMTGEVAYLD